MSLAKRLTDEMKAAMKAKDAERLSAIRMIINAVKIKEKNIKRDLTDEEIIAVIAIDIKKRKDSIAQFAKGERADLVAAEEQGISYLIDYLPDQLSDEAVKKIVDAAITEALATSMKDIGAVMKLVMPKVKGKADGGLINKLVNELLSG